MALPAILAIAAILFASPPGACGALAQNPHDFQRIGCTHCHLYVPGQGSIVKKKVFRKNIDDLCQECHAAALEDNINHRVGIKPSMQVPEDLHLNEQGELSCITCHDPHGEYIGGKSRARTYFLRRQMLKRELCLACHAQENYQEPKAALTLLAPTNNAVVDTLPVPLIGKASDSRLEEIAVEINDTRLVLSVRNKAFSTLLKLREGINTVRLTGPGVEPVTMNILYNPTQPKEMTYHLYRSHGMLNRKDCFVCHEEHARSYTIPAQDAILCAKCHDRRGTARFVHGPVGTGSCTVCHDPHGQTNTAFLVRTGEGLCFQCHTEAEVVRHLGPEGPFLREKGCLFCHDPHESGRRFLLRERL